MTVLLWIIIILCVIVLILCKISDDPLINETYLTFIMCVLLIIVISFLSEESNTQGYKQGQTDALNGKWKYKIERTDTIKQPIIIQK